MDTDDNDSVDKPKHSFRIRFTINSNQSTPDSSSDSRSGSNCHSHCDQSEAKPDCNCDHRVHHNCGHYETDESSTAKQRVKTNRLFQFAQKNSHKSSLFVNLTNTNLEQTQKTEPDQCQRGSQSPCTPDPDNTSPIEQNNASSDCSSTLEANDSSELVSEQVVRSALSDNNVMSQGCNFINSWVSANRSRSASVTPTAPNTNSSNASSSTTSAATQTSNSSRRASSSSDLPYLHDGRLSATNKLVGSSNETICDSEPTQTNSRLAIGSEVSANNYSNLMRPLQVDVNDSKSTSTYDSQYQQMQMEISHPISMDDIMKIDHDKQRLEDECSHLEAQVQMWEQKVDELERRRFVEDVPRTLVENVLRQRKRLRELEYEIYKLNLESEESVGRGYLSSQMACNFLPNNMSPSSDQRKSVAGTGLGMEPEPKLYTAMDAHSDYDRDLNAYANDADPILNGCLGGIVEDKLSTGKFGSRIRPGQENTADILDAIPPSGSLQQRQYLCRASSGTDTSSYSQLPIRQEHKHLLPLSNSPQCGDYDDDASNYVMKGSRQNPGTPMSPSTRDRRRHPTSSRPHYLIDQQTVYVDDEHVLARKSQAASHDRHRISPVRPNHFKGEFKPTQMVISQDSSSTASSSSSPH